MEEELQDQCLKMTQWTDGGGITRKMFEDDSMNQYRRKYKNNVW